MKTDQLLDERDYRLILQLCLAARRRTAGLVSGEQRSPTLGGGIEFADYREYQPGDDPRLIDWSVFLRLRRLLVRLCAEEKELTLMLLLDGSHSMRYGNPEKLRTAARIAAVLAGIALEGGNRAGILTLGPKLKVLMPPERNGSGIMEVIRALNRMEETDQIDIPVCTRQFSARYGRRCLAVFISDMLYPEWLQALNGIAASGSEGYVIQVLAPEELHPSFWGETTLTDMEDGREVSLHVDAGLIQHYRRELAEFLRGVRNASRRNGYGYILAPTDRPLGKIFHQDLRKEGLLC